MTTRATIEKSRRQRRMPAPAETGRFDVIAPLAIALGAVLLFSVACVGDFVFWDDNLNVSKNPFLNPPTGNSFAYFWSHPFLGLYIPLTYSVWTLLATVAHLQTPDANGIQLNPWVFHTANVLVHAGASAIVYLLLRRLSSRPWPAAVGAVLFAVHPIQVEAVAWVTGMKDVLCGALTLAALWQYAEYAIAQRTSAGRRQWAHYGAAAALFILAMLAKPLAVVAPVLILIIDWGIVQRPLKRVLLSLLPLFAAALVVGWLSIQVQVVEHPADGGRVLLRPLIAADALAFYFYQLVVPLQFAFQYDHTPTRVIAAGWLYFTWLAPAALLGAALLFRKRAVWGLLALALFVVGAAPVLGLTPFAFQRYSTVADRYVYLSMFGIAYAAAMGLSKWIARRAATKTAALPPWAIAAVVSLLVLLAVRTLLQTFVWQDDAALFTNALRVNPRSAAAYDGMAGVLASQRPPKEDRAAALARLQAASEYARKAIALAPDNPDGYLTLGSILQPMGEPSQAADAFARAAQIAPDKPEALAMHGAALAGQGHLDEGESFLKRAIAINPALSQAHLNLGMLYAQERKMDDALSETRLAVGLDTGNAMARLNYAMLLTMHGQSDEALAQWQAARQIDPTLPALDNVRRAIMAHRSE